MARILIAVAWPYANGPFHLGHLAGAYLPGDIFARYHRLRGDEVLMVSGSDMHGTPILVTAEKEGTSAEEVAGRYHEVNRTSFERLGFSFDVFTTTRTVEHERTVQEVFLALFERGFVRKRTDQAPYCPKHRRFLPDRYLVGTCPHCGFEEARGDECDRCGRPLEARSLRDARCSLCGTRAELLPTEHFYLELDRLAPKLTEYLGQQAHWRSGTLRVAENFLKEGLHPTAITRDLAWGVPIPLDGYAGKRFYVWFEALIGYLSASREWAIRSGKADAWRRFWDEREPVRAYYFVGKDNKFHHTIVWPSMLLGVGGLKLPFDVPANEWLLIEGKKVSKSRTEEREAFVPSLLEHYPPDVIRFYGALLAPQNHDTELDWAEFDKLHAEILANQYGNLAQRALVFARDRYQGRVPEPPAGWSAEDPAGVGPRLARAHAEISAELEKVHLKEALDRTLEEVREANRRFHEAQPWKAAEPERARIVYETIWSLRALSTWLAPVLPFSSAELYRMLGFSEPPAPGDWERALEPVPAGQSLGEIRPLFPRPESSAASPPAAARAPPAPPGPTGREGPVPLSVRAARVVAVTPHPSADRLYVLELDLGPNERRTVVAGLRTAYREEELRGRDVVLLANLAPRTIRKVTSQGMVLAVETPERPVVLEPSPGTPPGTFLEGSGASDPTIEHEEFARVVLAVGQVVGPASGGDGSLVDVGGPTVRVAGSWTPGTWGVVRRERADAEEGVLLAFGPGRAVRPSAPVPAGAGIR
jgi:methionyl-tRNA synthetase